VGRLKGKKNGELILAAELAGYDVLLTVDQGLRHQQSSAGRKLSIMLMRSQTNQLEESRSQNNPDRRNVIATERCSLPWPHSSIL
jgi:hypothetical protein